MIRLSAKTIPTAEELEAVWAELRGDLIPDGSLRDICVENTSQEQWRQFLECLHAVSYRIEYRYGDELRPLPRDPSELFRQREQPHLIRIDVGGLWLHCHCFTPEEIELDLNPAEITETRLLEKLVRFLAQLARALSRDVIVTHENIRQAVFLVLHAGH